MRSRTSGTGTASSGGNGVCAVPFRPSIQATSARANSGTSLQGTPADVRSWSLCFDMKKPSVVDRGGQTDPRDPLGCPTATSPCGIHLARAGRLAGASAPLLMYAVYIGDHGSGFQA